MLKPTSNAAVPPLRISVKVAILVPALPSLMVTSEIETEPATKEAGSDVMNRSGVPTASVATTPLRSVASLLNKRRVPSGENTGRLDAALAVAPSARWLTRDTVPVAIS